MDLELMVNISDTSGVDQASKSSKHSMLKQLSALLSMQSLDL